MKTDFTSQLAPYVSRIIAERTAIVEDDLEVALGWRVKLSPNIIRRLGYEVVYQKVSEDAMVSDYRGIRRNGRWIIDRFPNRPQPSS